MLERTRVAVFDLEIKNPIEKLTKGWKSHDEMGVSCLVIYDYMDMRYRVFDDHNMKEGLEILCSYDIVSGFNTVNFDWKVLQATYLDGFPLRESVDFDILREIWIAKGLDPDVFSPYTHGGYKLDDVAFDTLGMRKTLNGALAPVLYQAGKMAELIDYCIEDVRIEKTLFEFAVKHGYVIRSGNVIKLNLHNIHERISL